MTSDTHHTILSIIYTTLGIIMADTAKNTWYALKNPETTLLLFVFALYCFALSTKEIMTKD